MTYLEFLGDWYNLAFLAIGTGGLGCAAAGRVLGRDLFRVATALILTAVSGLTLNGAIHDLGLGGPAPRFPIVFVLSALVGWSGAWRLSRWRARHFRPISGVQFNLPGQEGVEARLVTRGVGPAPGSGRAQWQDDEGTLHIVHVHTAGEELGFGRRVRLDSFDSRAESYLVTPMRRRRIPFARNRGSRL
jgi:hypothetical protein